MIRKLELYITMAEVKVLIWMSEQRLKALNARRRKMSRMYHSGKMTSLHARRVIEVAMKETEEAMEGNRSKQYHLKSELQYIQAQLVVA